MINIQNRSVVKEGSVIMSNRMELGTGRDESLAFSESEYAQLKAQLKGKSDSRKFYINHRQFPQLTIYLLRFMSKSTITNKI